MVLMIHLDRERVMTALYVAAKNDRTLLDRNLTRVEGRQLVQKTLETYGHGALDPAGLEDGLSDYEAGMICGWSTAQAPRIDVD